MSIACGRLTTHVIWCIKHKHKVKWNVQSMANESCSSRHLWQTDLFVCFPIFKSVQCLSHILCDLKAVRIDFSTFCTVLFNQSSESCFASFKLSYDFYSPWMEYKPCARKPPHAGHAILTDFESEAPWNVGKALGSMYLGYEGLLF